MVSFLQLAYSSPTSPAVCLTLFHLPAIGHSCACTGGAATFTEGTYVKRSSTLLLAAFAVVLGGCAQANFPGPITTPTPQPFTISVTPTAPVLPGLTTQQFAATTSDGSHPALTWSVNGVAGGNATLGIISAGGLYTAPEFPPAPNTIAVSAAETSDATKSGSATATLNNPVPVLTAATPTSIPVGPFTLSITGLHFAPGATVYFGSTALVTTYVSSTQLTATGTAANSQAGNITITVVNPNPGSASSAGVTAQVMALGVVVNVTPATANVRAGSQQVFAANVTGTTDTGVIWAVNGIVGGNASLGAIVGNGNYSAPATLPSPNSITVTATSLADSTKSGNSAVTLQNAAPVLATETPTIITTGNFQLALTGTGFMNGSIVNFGTEQLSTTFVSPTQLTAVGTATAAEVGNIGISVTNPNPGSATSNILTAQVVAPNPNIKVTISPTSATVGAGNQVQFVATVTGTTNMSVSWSVNSIPYGNDTVGNMDGNGNYTAPIVLPSSSTVTVTATSNADNTKSASATVTLQNPKPVLTAVTPGTLGLGAFQLTLYGTGFVSSSTATFGGQPLTVTYVTSTMITAIGTATSTQVGQDNVIVTNPAPGGGTSGAVPVAVTTAGTPASSSAAVRFLEQASFGPNLETVNQVEQTGFDTYLQNQFASVVTPYPNPRTNDSINTIQKNFFLNSVAGGDQLRERASLALNELWVVGADKVGDPLGYTNYLRTLSQDALGNYYNLMYDVTLTPAMGHYLDMVDNDAPAPGQHANENYAREIMQLFCLGLNQLNPDGTPVLDASGKPVSTYTQSDVMDLGRAFTGWTYPVQPGKSPQTHNPEYYGGNMVPVEANHDSGAKTILGQAIPAGQSAESDLSAALTIIFNHPNVGPFVAYQLIVHLVSSNPSPAYVQRVAQAFNTGSFNGYGTGKRGDLQATVAAVLLDPEARRGDVPATSVATDGKLREPVIMIASLVRAFHGKTDAAGFSYQSDSMSQDIFYPPTVFNFFPPINPVAGTTLNGPEFGIFNTNTSLARMNFIDALVYDAIGANTTLDFSPVVNAGSQAQMITWLDTLFLHGTTPAPMQQAILTAMGAVDPADTTGQAQAAIYLFTSSSLYQVQH